ncbi:calcium-dependent protein kinase 2-like [Sycon ciliatum]|uniref:calcium-dependent protein kinase 2-like n=1 Tax=Sycon ciliatum TaxID=27933 RepID=UPI0031F6CC29
MDSSWPTPFPVDLFGEPQEFNDSSATAVLGSLVRIEKTKLGQGQFGAVHIARIPGAKSVAAKIFRNPEKERFDEIVIKELRIALKLRHPNIAACYGAMQCKQWPVMFFEHVDGVTLKEMYLAAWGKRSFLTEATLRPIFLQVLQVLHYLETAKVVHVDLKYDNVMVRRDGVVKLIDFGVAQDIAEGKSMKLQPQMYTHPPEVELAGMGGYDNKADIFFAGSLLYFLLCYIHPFGDFQNLTSGERVQKIAEGVNKTDERYKTLSRHVRRLIDVMVAYHPDERPTAAQALQVSWFTRAREHQQPELISYEPPVIPQTAEDLNAKALTRLAVNLAVLKDELVPTILKDNNSWQSIAYRATVHEMEVLAPKTPANTTQTLPSERTGRSATSKSVDEGKGSSLEKSDSAAETTPTTAGKGSSRKCCVIS